MSIQTLKNQPYFPFLILFIASGIIAIGALRHNNQTMVSLRNDVYTADKNNEDVDAALNKLRTYVYAHMNTNLSSGTGVRPPIQLPYTYERLASQASQKVNQASLYTDAENYCQAVVPASVSISGRGRISCVQNYITSHGGKSAPAIPASLYQFDFISPSWSPDLAGWSLVAMALSGLLLLLTFILSRFTKIRLII